MDTKYEVSLEPGGHGPSLAFSPREFCAACSAASEDLAGWSLLCPEIDVSMGSEPRISAANQGAEGAGRAGPAPNLTLPTAIETVLAAMKTFLKFLPGQWRRGSL